MPDNIDALIANFAGTLQQNALTQMQTQLGAQKSQANALALQQQIAAQNALRNIYGNQANWDQTTGLPRTNTPAFGQLMQTGSPEGLEFIGAAAKLSEVNSRAAMMNLKARDYYGGLLQQGVIDPTSQFAMSLDPRLSQTERDQKIAAFQEERMKETAAQYGVPDSERDRWENLGRWQPSWILGSERLQARQDAIAKEWKDDNFDPETGQKYSTNKYYPGLAFTPDHQQYYTPSGVSKEQVKTHGPLYEVTGTGADGKPYKMRVRENELGHFVDANDPTRTVEVPTTPDVKMVPIQEKGSAQHWLPYTTPDGKQLFYNPETQEIREPEGIPQGSVKSGVQPRSMSAMYMQRWLQQHPEATPEELNQAGADYTRNQSIERAFGGGILGRNLVSLNTLADHIRLFRQYADALKTKNIQAQNRIEQFFATQTGSPEVIKYALAGTITGDETVRLLTTTGGTAGDRSDIHKLLAPYMSEQQMAGAADTLTDYVRGRYAPLRQQYARGDAEREKYFDDKMVTPEARGLFGKDKTGAAVEKPAGAAAPSYALPEKYWNLPDGTPFRNGQYKKQGHTIIPAGQ